MAIRRLRADEALDRRAERLVEMLCAVPLARWRAAALATARAPGESLAAMALEHALASVDRVRLWQACDDLETALHRLTSEEACGIVRDGWECQCIRVVSRHALEAVLCDGCLAREHVEALAGPLLRLAG